MLLPTTLTNLRLSVYAKECFQTPWVCGGPRGRRGDKTPPILQRNQMERNGRAENQTSIQA